MSDAQKAGKPISDPTRQFDPMLLSEESLPRMEPLPSVVVIVDELADMMMVVGKKVEELIARIAKSPSSRHPSGLPPSGHPLMS